MKALDTNVLVRFLVKDDEQQTKAAYRRFKEAGTNKEAYFPTAEYEELESDRQLAHAPLNGVSIL